MTKYTYDISCFSDLHKDATGCRPSSYFWEWVEQATPDELQAEWDNLVVAVDHSIREQEQWQADALKNLEMELTKTCSSNNVSVDTAIRWMHDAYNTNGDNEYLDYHLGVKYGTVKRLLEEVK
jgi:hypothetical protein